VNRKGVLALLMGLIGTQRWSSNLHETSQDEREEMMMDQECGSSVTGDASGTITVDKGNRLHRVKVDGTTLAPPKRRRLLVKKLAPELRRRKPSFRFEPVWYQRLLWRLKEDSQFFRSAVQAAFALLCIWIGIEFYLFVGWGTSAGADTFVRRPPGVDGFLPISSLISLKYWLHTGIINDMHPAGVAIFAAILTIGLLLKKAFCSWLCPIGTLSESLWRLGRKLFRKNLRIPRWMDYPLRSIKYFLLFFFVYSVWQMDAETLKNFIYSPYNKVADIKMYFFFAHLTSFAFWTILSLVVLSAVIQNFWCRYLCPYGGLLGILSLLSPLKITRQKSTCIDCELCTKACPAAIKVHEATRVWSDECMSCLECVEACPVKNTLDLRTRRGAAPVANWVFGSLVVGVFVAISGYAMLAGHWQNAISGDEYARRFQQLDSPVYQHFGGEVAPYGPTE
jgi:polyferredoxin